MLKKMRIFLVLLIIIKSASSQITKELKYKGSRVELDYRESYYHRLIMNIQNVTDNQLAFTYEFTYYTLFSFLSNSYTLSYCFHNIKTDNNCTTYINRPSSTLTISNSKHTMYHYISNPKKYTYISIFISKSGTYNYNYAYIQSISAGLSGLVIFFIVFGAVFVFSYF